MLSRVADHLYWMARYTERAENLARLVQVSLELLLDAAALGGKSLDTYWSPVLAATAMEDTFNQLYPEPKPGDIAAFLTTDERNPDSILSCVKQARENARTVRDQISDEMWAELNDLFLFVRSKSAISLLHRSPQSFYDKIIQSSLLFDGITTATFPRSEGWNFIQLGRCLERADKTSRLLDIRTHAVHGEISHALEAVQWSTILRSCSAFTTFRRLYGGEITTGRVIDLLIFSAEFPRSVRFCVRAVDDLLHNISGTPTGHYSNAAEKVVGSLLAKLNFGSIDDVLQRGLHLYIDDLQQMLNAAGQTIFETYVLLPQEVNRLAHQPHGAHHPFPELEEQQQQQQQQ